MFRKKQKGLSLKEFHQIGSVETLMRRAEEFIGACNEHKINELTKQTKMLEKWIRFLLDELNYEVIEVSDYDYTNNFRLYADYQFVGKNSEGRNVLVKKLTTKLK